MKCPECRKPADVIETRDKGVYTRRRYVCFNEHRFSTMERVHTFHAGGGSQLPEVANQALMLKLKEMLK